MTPSTTDGRGRRQDAAEAQRHIATKASIKLQRLRSSETIGNGTDHGKISSFGRDISKQCPTELVSNHVYLWQTWAHLLGCKISLGLFSFKCSTLVASVRQPCETASSITSHG